MNCVNVIAMKDQFLEEETRDDSIVRKTILEHKCLDRTADLVSIQSLF